MIREGKTHEITTQIKRTDSLTKETGRKPELISGFADGLVALSSKKDNTRNSQNNSRIDYHMTKNVGRPDEHVKMISESEKGQ